MKLWSVAEKLVTDAIDNGGGTVTRDGLEYGGSGYAVGGYASTLIVNKDARDLLTQVAAWLLGDEMIGANYFGSWEDGGLLYFDAVNMISNEDEAIALGKARGELAIYDCGACREVRL